MKMATKLVGKWCFLSLKKWISHGTPSVYFEENELFIQSANKTTTTPFKMKGDVKIERLAKLNNMPGIKWLLFSNRKFKVCLLFVHWYYHAMTKQISVSTGPNCVYHTGFINCKKSHECFQDENVVRFPTFALTWRREEKRTASAVKNFSYHGIPKLSSLAIVLG